MTWRCICGQMVEDRYPAHTHAEHPRFYDDLMLRSFLHIGQPPDIWTYERPNTVDIPAAAPVRGTDLVAQTGDTAHSAGGPNRSEN